MMTDTKAIRTAVVMAGAILVSSAALVVMRKLGAIDHETSTRLLAAGFGLIVAFQGNAIPKTLTALRADRDREARAQACRRRAGWTFLIAGLGYSAVWLLLPLPLAMPVSMAVLVIGIAGPLGWTKLRRLA
jgi:hypothetical protein